MTLKEAQLLKRGERIKLKSYMFPQEVHGVSDAGHGVVRVWHSKYGLQSTMIAATYVVEVVEDE